MICNIPNLDLVSINAYTKFGKILSICSQDIEKKQNYEGKLKSSLFLVFQSWAIITWKRDYFPSMTFQNKIWGV